VSPPCTVLIAAADLLPKLTQRAADPEGEVLAFTDADALRALEAITKRRPALVALERVFAATPRGTALINRIKADPTLTHMEVRVVAHDAEFVRPARLAAAGNGGAPAAAPAPAFVHQPPAPPVKAPLDQRGTRRAPRFRLKGPLDVVVDGNQAELVDLSTIGAQVVSATVLKPNQRVRMALTDEEGTVRFNASVAWASFEIPPGSGPRYRAGVQFIDANAPAVDSYCQRHKP
jgi:hypothetical protein